MAAIITSSVLSIIFWRDCYFFDDFFKLNLFLIIQEQKFNSEKRAQQLEGEQRRLELEVKVCAYEYIYIFVFYVENACLCKNIEQMIHFDM